MIKWISDIIEVIKWAAGHVMHGTSFPLMLPGNRALEVAEQQRLSRKNRDLNRMFQGLPSPHKEGQKITLVGQGFKKDVIVRQGRWCYDG